MAAFVKYTLAKDYHAPWTRFIFFWSIKAGAHLRHCVYWALEHSELRAIITGTLPVHRPSILGTRTKRSCLQREQKCIGRESNPGLAESSEVLKTSHGNGQFYH